METPLVNVKQPNYPRPLLSPPPPPAQPSSSTFLQEHYFAICVIEIHTRYFLQEATLLYFFSEENKLLFLLVRELKLIDFVF